MFDSLSKNQLLPNEMNSLKGGSELEDIIQAMWDETPWGCNSTWVAVGEMFIMTELTCGTSPPFIG